MRAWHLLQRTLHFPPLKSSLPQTKQTILTTGVTGAWVGSNPRHALSSDSVMNKMLTPAQPGINHPNASLPFRGGWGASAWWGYRNLSACTLTL